MANSPKATLEESTIDVREKLAEKANVGARTYSKGKKIAFVNIDQSGQPYQLTQSQIKKGENNHEKNQRNHSTGISKHIRRKVSRCFFRRRNESGLYALIFGSKLEFVIGWKNFKAFGEFAKGYFRRIYY